MEKDITYYTNLILSDEVQTLITPYRDVFILISIIFIVLGLVLLFQEKFFIAEIKRRIFDYLSDGKKFDKPKRFVRSWQKIEKLFKKGDYGEMIICIDKLMLEILIRFGYVGDNTISIIDGGNVVDTSFPNKDNVKRVCELSQKIKKETNMELERSEMIKIFDLSKDTLIRINILKK